MNKIKIRYSDPQIFRIDPAAIRSATEKEMKRVIEEQMIIEKLKNSNLIKQEFIPMINTFSKTHAAETLSANNGETLIFYEKVPEGFIGFLESIALTPLGAIPGTWYRVLVDGETLDGYSSSNGRIIRAIGTFVEPRPLVPPIVVYKSLKVYAGNTTSSSWSAGFSCEGVHVQKPQIFNKQNPIVDVSTIRDFVRYQR